jgi:hypothetical protein
MRKGIKEALIRVTEIVAHAETECSQEVHGHDKACEKFHYRALPSDAPARPPRGAPRERWVLLPYS